MNVIVVVILPKELLYMDIALCGQECWRLFLYRQRNFPPQHILNILSLISTSYCRHVYLFGLYLLGTLSHEHL